jgi:hypothetical protein
MKSEKEVNELIVETSATAVAKLVELHHKPYHTIV